MDFVAIDTDIASDRITIDLARTFRLRRAEAVGLLTLTFAMLARRYEHGNLADVLDEEIEEWARWHGKAGAFAAFIRARLCEADGTVRAWEDWNGKMIRRAKAERQRLREYREAKAAEREAERASRTSPNESRTRSRTRTDDVQDSYATRLPDLTRPDLTEPTTGTTPLLPEQPAKAAGGGWPAAIAEEWTRRVGVVREGRVGKDLRPFVRLYPDPAAAQAAVVKAVGIYADLCARRNQKPSWPDFVRGVPGFVPATLLPPERAA